MATKKIPTIGTIFSSSSSDEDLTLPRPRRSVGQVEERPRPRTDVSDNNIRPRSRITLRVSDSAKTSTEEQSRRRVERITIPEGFDAPDGYRSFDKTRVGTLANNTLVQYETFTGKVVKPKYFKKSDTIAGTIVVGFYKHNRRNYSEALSNIKSLFVKSGGISGGANSLKDTVEIPRDQWSNLRRDMVLSYEKDNGEYVFKAKFNSFTKGSDGSTRMSLTTDRGFSYTANPEKMIKVFRHFTAHDKTTTFILEALRKLEIRVRELEGNRDQEPSERRIPSKRR